MANYKWCGFKVTHQFIIVWLSLAAFLHNILMNGANNVIISSLQKEFYLSSRETGAYVSIYDVGSIISAVFIPIVSANGSKAKWISFGMIMLFLGCQITTLPHFFRANGLNPNNENKSIELCNNSDFVPKIKYPYIRQMPINSNSSVASLLNQEASPVAIVKDSKPIFQLKYLLYIGNTINGLSSASMTSLAFSYIEDIAPHHLSAVYESVYYAVGALGMGVGFIATSNCLSFHTDFNRPDNVVPDWLTSNHPNWIGAWWLPFILFGFISLLLATVIFLFPKKIDNEVEEQTKNSHELDKLNKPEKPGTNDNDNGIHTAESKGANENKILKALEETGSIISLNKLGYHSSQNHIDKTNNSKKLSDSYVSLASIKQGYRTLLKKTASLFTNPVYVFLLITQTIEGLLQNSFLAFASLFLEYQYRLSSSTTALVIGFLSLPPLIFGGLLSGFICKKLKNDTLSCFKFICGILFINVFVYSGFMMFCQQPLLVTNSNYESYSSLLKIHGLDETTNPQKCYKTSEDCNCNTQLFKPVCLVGSQDVYFQSPCLAGCKDFTKSPAITDYYSNCSQIECDYYYKSDSERQGKFIDGMCPAYGCETKLIATYGCIFLLMLLNALLFLPYLKVTIGSVDAKEMNTIVLGLKQFSMNLFGTLPGPILFGSVIDMSCNYWHTDESGQRVCKLYNNEQFAFNFALLGMGFKTICFFLMVVSLIITMNRRHKNVSG